MMLWSHGVIAASDASANVPRIDAAPKVFCKETRGADLIGRV